MAFDEVSIYYSWWEQFAKGFWGGSNDNINNRSISQENKQNLIVEGCYIPFDWSKYFEPEYLDYIRYYCLVMSDNYIKNHFNDIKKYANVVENRGNDEDCTIETVLRDNAKILELCQSYKANYLLIDEDYQIDVKL